MQKILPLLALAVSLLALVIAGYTYLRADALAQDAVDRRERALVERLEPEVMAIYHDFGILLTPQQQNPRTLADLIEPLFIVMDSAMGGDE